MRQLLEDYAAAQLEALVSFQDFMTIDPRYAGNDELMRLTCGELFPGSPGLDPDGVRPRSAPALMSGEADHG